MAALLRCGLRGAAAAFLAALATAGVAAETPLRAVADGEAPRRIEGAEPAYPEEARARGIEGVVLVGFTVDPEGWVKDPRVLSGHAVFEEAALAAVRRWRYRPTRKKGRPVPVQVVETVPFWLGPGTRPEGWPAGTAPGAETWVTWPGQYSHLKLETFGTEELPPPSTLRVYRGSVRNVTKNTLARVVAAAVARESLNGPKTTTSADLGDLAPGEERPFELRPEGHQVSVVFGQVVDGEARPLATLRQVVTMARVLPSRPVVTDRIQSCLVTVSPSMDYDRPPRVARQSRPDYPRPAFDAGLEGTVLAEIVIDADGHVACARVLRSLPGTGLDEEALKTLYGWRFEPAVKGGRPVPTIAHAPVHFRIY